MKIINTYLINLKQIKNIVTNNNNYLNFLYSFIILHLSDLLISNGLQPIKEIGP